MIYTQHQLHKNNISGTNPIGLPINYAIFAEVDEDLASTLENNAIYTLNGKYKGYVKGKLKLPSGKVFDYPSSCYKTSLDEYGTVCIDGFLFYDISVIKTTIKK